MYRQPLTHEHFDPPRLAVVRRWLAEDWPLARVAYPGRDPSWQEWDALPE